MASTPYTHHITKRGDITSLRSEELKVALTQRGLDPKGNVVQLKQRLRDFIFPDAGPLSQAASGSSSQTPNDSVTDPSQNVNSVQTPTVLADGNGHWNLLKINHGPVLTRIPKASRTQASIAYRKILENLIAKNDREAWEKYLNFARSAIGRSVRGGRKQKSLATTVKERVESYMTGNPRNIPVPKKGKNPPTIKQLVSRKMASADIQGAVRILTSNDKLMLPSDETMTKLKTKHPETHPDSTIAPDPEDENSCFKTNKETLLKALRSFKTGVSGGPDGLTPQHLKDMCEDSLGEPATKLVDTLVDFMNLIIYPGKVPWEICHIFFGANLIALEKPDGGVRPIAMGCTPRRLAAKIIAFETRKFCEIELRPNQVGVGTPKGAEAAVHALRSYLENPSTANKVLLKIDFKNAYNTIRRDVILNLVKQKLPKVYNFAHQCYSKSTNLIFDSEVLLSQEGVQQGDPLGGLFFSLGIQDEIVRKMKSEFNCWYLDDGSLAGDLKTVLGDFTEITKAAETHGLDLNATKCELFLINPISDDCKDALASFNLVKNGVKLIPKHQLTLLGAPIFPEAIEEVLQQKISDLENMTERLKVIDSHEALYLLRNCFAMPKLTYFLRTSPCFTKPETLKKFDDIIRTSLINILNIPLSEMSYDQATLPVAKGGLGIRPASEIAIPGFLSSVHASTAIANTLLPQTLQQHANVHWESALDIWKEKSGKNEIPEDPMYQASWDKPLYEARFENLFQQANNVHEKARLLAISSESASDWLHALPIPSLGLHLDPIALGIACGLRLNAKVCQPHVCICGAMVEENGRHGLACGRQQGRHPRHSEINELVKRALVQAQQPAIREPRGLTRTDDKRTDGMTQFAWKEGKNLLWDVTVADTLCASHVNRCSKYPGAAAEKLESNKFTTYRELLDNYYFVPVGIETFGAWGPEGHKLIKEIGKKLKEVTGEQRSTFFLTQRISMAIQRGNSSSVQGTVPSTEGWDEIFEFMSHEG